MKKSEARMKMPMKVEYNRLHDATLKHLSFSWDEGQLSLEFDTCETPSRHFILTANQVSDLRCPRKLPWGMSVSVNELRRPVEAANKRIRCELEMQSGDVIAFEADSVGYTVTQDAGVSE